MVKADFLLKKGIPEKWVEYARKRCAVDMRDHYFFWEAYQLLDLLEKAGIKELKGLKILDAGCGFGVVDCLLTMMGCDVTLLDYDMEYLNKSRGAFHELIIQAKLIKGDIFKMPFKGEKFDIVWNGGVVEHFEKPSEVIRQMALLTKSGGYVFVSVPAMFTPHTFIIRPYRRRIRNFYFDIWGREKSFTEKGLIKEMKMAGLKDIIASTCNLRRTFVDDYVVAPRLKRYLTSHIAQILNFFDWVEMNIPFMHCLGFSVGAIGKKA
jgi:2-polyprenyl-3-methyl-5-hydroxy-6-metoxy-1,4-benzoquinol methylase